MAETFTIVQGGRYPLPEPGIFRAQAFVFVMHDCPIANGYALEIVRLVQAYTPRDVRFCLVYAERELPLAEAKKHTDARRWPCPALLDPELRLARRFGVTVTPTAVVVDHRGKSVYAGRLDDRYYAFGRSRPTPTRTEFKDALDAVLAGRRVPAAKAPPLGCYIDFGGK